MNKSTEQTLNWVDLFEEKNMTSGYQVFKLILFFLFSLPKTVDRIGTIIAVQIQIAVQENAPVETVTPG